MDVATSRREPAGRGGPARGLPGRVVVAVEDLLTAGPALSWAAASARRRGAAVQLLAVVDHGTGGASWADPFTAAYLATRAGERLAAARRVLDVARATVARQAPDVRVSVRVVAGTAHEVLVEVSASADLLVLGAPRRGFRGGGGVGPDSTAVRVAAGSGCPLVVVRSWDRCDGPVVLGHDGSPLSDVALDFAADEAGSRGVELVVTRVRERCFAHDGDVPAVDAAAARIHHRHPHLAVRAHEVDGPYSCDGLIAVAAGAQLLVVGSGGEHGHRTAPLGSTSRALVRCADVALAVVPCSAVPDES